MLRRTVRMRLTMLYGGLFLASGAALLAVTYALVVHTSANFVLKNQDLIVSVPVSPEETTEPGSAIIGGPRSTSPGQTPGQGEQLRRLQHLARSQRDDQLHQLLTQSGIALAVMAVASIGLGWIVAGRVLRPLRTITRTVHEISATNLHRRIAGGGPHDELRDLGDTFDQLLDRLEAAFGAQRRFVANASHELRTPLARQRTLIQVAMADPDATVASLRSAHERVLVANREHERLIEALLTLARSDAGLEQRTDIDLGQLTERALLAYESEAARRGLTLTSMSASAPATGDPHLAERLINNLIENALRHNIAGGEVDVSTGMADGRATVSMANTGPMIPPDQLDRLFQPFQRLSMDRSHQDGGAGLGLSIVRAIATAHDADLTAEARPGGGLRITVTFPPPLGGPAEVAG